MQRLVHTARAHARDIDPEPTDDHCSRTTIVARNGHRAVPGAVSVRRALRDRRRGRVAARGARVDPVPGPSPPRADDRRFRTELRVRLPADRDDRLPARAARGSGRGRRRGVRAGGFRRRGVLRQDAGGASVRVRSAGCDGRSVGAPRSPTHRKPAGGVRIRRVRAAVRARRHRDARTVRRRRRRRPQPELRRAVAVARHGAEPGARPRDAARAAVRGHPARAGAARPGGRARAAGATTVLLRAGAAAGGSVRGGCALGVRRRG